jgi:hypothetical protein
MSGKNRLGCFGARDQGRCDNHLTRLFSTQKRARRPPRRFVGSSTPSS